MVPGKGTDGCSLFRIVHLKRQSQSLPQEGIAGLINENVQKDDELLLRWRSWSLCSAGRKSVLETTAEFSTRLSFEQVVELQFDTIYSTKLSATICLRRQTRTFEASE